MFFWQGILLFSLISVIFVIWPLIKFPFRRLVPAVRVERDVTQLELFKEHLADLDESLERGDIDQAQFDQLKAELQLTLLEDAENEQNTLENFGGKKILVGLAVIAPIVAVALYAHWGAKPEWDIYQTMLSHKENPPETREEMTQAARELLIQIRSRLKQKPDNHQLRYMLGERSMDIQDYDEAVKAYRHLLEIQPSSPMVATRLAQALFARGGNRVTPEMAELLDGALTQAPFLYPALELGGIVAFHNKEYAKAAQLWERAYSQVDKEGRAGKALASGIVQARMSLAAQDKDGSKATSSKGAAENKVASATDASAQTASETQAAPGKITVNVSLGSSVASAPSDTVFVYARAWKGAKMPLAIKKMTVADLPATVTLDKSMAMAPGMDITTVPELEILARISKTGTAVPKPGDWQASAGPIKLSAELAPQSLEINTRL